MTFSVFLQPQAEILADLLQAYYPKGAKVIDFTYGTGGLWWKVKESPLLAPLYPITACDAAPNKKLAGVGNIHKKDLLRDDYSDLGLHDVGVFDPPYLIGRGSFDVPNAKKGVVPTALQGPRSWSQDELGKYTTNRTVTDFNQRVEGLRQRAPQAIKRGGLLLVKVMDVRNNGSLVPHHVSCINILSKSFDYIDTGIYIRQGATTWKPKEGLQGLHGYWLVFRLRKEDPFQEGA